MSTNDYRSGLTNDEVIKSRRKNGTNSISNDTKNSFWNLLLESLGDPIIKILLIVLAVKTVFLFQSFDWFETLGIVVAITLASLISTVSEYGSEKSFERMQEESAKAKCKVIRDSSMEEIYVDDIVVGDTLILATGDAVGADGHVVEGTITCDESSFTGESRDVEKKIGNNVFRGSIVLNGNAYVVIDNVGTNTKYGKIALELLDKNPESPLKARLRELANIISRIGYTGAVLVFFSYLFSVIFVANNFNFTLIRALFANPHILFGHIIYALTLAVTIIIVSVPEGLPMMIALVLSSNMKRMVKENVLVRRMVGIETAGSIDTLLSDKTGTITKGEMEVVGVIFGDGSIKRAYDEISAYPKISKYIFEGMKANNEAKLGKDGKVIGGNITDKAMLEFSKNYKGEYKIIKHEYFDSVKKYSSVMLDDGELHELYKGAPEKLLLRTHSYYNRSGEVVILDKNYIQSLMKRYTKRGYRALLIADRQSKYAESLILVAIVLLKDEVSDTAKDAISMIKSAGCQTIMITGDAKDTAENIGREIGLIDSENDLILTSADLSLMKDEEIEEKFDRIKIIARALPSDKSRLVRLAQSMGRIVGMTGDGVNDAPALKCADVGFAMGSGSEVSKEASDVVILDNNLLSIGKAILYGRTIFKSIRKFIIFQLTMNLCALTLSITGPFLGINTPVTVMQMLWINMIMDTFAGLAFSFEPPLIEYMRAKPVKKNESIINKYMYSSILVTGIYTAILLILFLKVPFIKDIFRYDYEYKYLMTAFFGLFVFSGVFNAFNARTNRINVLANISRNKPFIAIISFIVIVQVFLLYKGGSTFRTYGLSLKEFFAMFALALSVIPVDIARKIILKRNGSNMGV